MTQGPSTIGSTPPDDAVGKPPRVKQGKPSKSSNQASNAPANVTGRETSREAEPPDMTTSSSATAQAKQRAPPKAVTCAPTLLKNDKRISEKNQLTDQAAEQPSDHFTSQANGQANGQAAVTAGVLDNQRRDTQPSYVNRGLRDDSRTEPRSKTRDGNRTREGPPSPPRFSHRHQQQSPNDAYGWFPQNDFVSAMSDGYAWPFADPQQPWFPYSAPFPPACGLFPPPYAAPAAAYPPPFNPYPQYPYVPYQPRAVYWPPQAPPYAPMSAYYGYPVAACPPPHHPDLAYPSPHWTFPPFASAVPTGLASQERTGEHPLASADGQAGGQTTGCATTKSQK